MSFNTTNYLLFNQSKKELDNELLESFVPWLVTRTFSFYDNDYIEYINESLNLYGNVFPTKEDQFLFFEHVIPKLKKKRINYLKKPKGEKLQDQVVPEFYSKRELNLIEDSKLFYET